MSDQNMFGREDYQPVSFTADLSTEKAPREQTAADTLAVMERRAIYDDLQLMWETAPLRTGTRRPRHSHT